MLTAKNAILRDLALINAHLNLNEKTHIEVCDDYSFTIILPDVDQDGNNKTKSYKPDVTPLKYHMSDDFVRILMGPVGSGKSVANLAEIILRTCAMPECYDGVRRARWAIVRNTYPELAKTTLKSFDDWFGKLGDVKATKAPLYRMLRFNDGKGPIELEIFPMALDRPEQASAVMSLELTGCYFNEVNYIPKEVFDRMQSRVAGRYPSAIDINHQPYWHGIIADCNPPDTDHWIYKTFEEQTAPEGFTLFKQPPGLIHTENGWVENPERENKEWLIADYYRKSALGKSKEYVKVFCLGQYGIAAQGKPIFPNYNDDFHGLDYIDADPNLPLYFGFDFGLTPACPIAQLLPDGRLQIVGECTSEWMDLKQFINAVLRPYLARRFPGFKYSESFIDPAGIQRAQTDGNSCFALLHQEAFNPKPASSNDLQVRFRAVNTFLDNMIMGKPRFTLSKRDCPVLRKALMDGYQFKELKFAKLPDGTPIFDEKPYKNKYSHIAEALQYLCMGVMDNPSQNKFDANRIKNFAPTAWS